MTKILSDKYPLLLILHLACLSSSCDLVTCTYTLQPPVKPGLRSTNSWMWSQQSLKEPKEKCPEGIDETISEESGPLATRLGVAIKEEMADKEYVPYKTRKLTQVLTGKPIQTKKTIHEKAEIEAEVVDLCSSDEEMEDVSGISTTAVKQEEEEGDDEDEDDSDDDAECTGESSEDSTDDEFGVAGLKQIYEEHFVGDEVQQMDTTEETEGTERAK